MKNEKGFAHMVLVVIVLLVLVAFGYLLFTDRFNFISTFEKTEKTTVIKEETREEPVSESDETEVIEEEIDQTDLDFSELDDELDALDNSASDL